MPWIGSSKPGSDIHGDVHTMAAKPKLTLTQSDRSSSTDSALVPQMPMPSLQEALSSGFPKLMLSWKGLLIGANICIAAGAAAVGSFLWIITLPPTPNCQNLSAMVPDSERLYCAQQAARSGKADDLILALNLVEPWGSNHPLYAQKQQYLENWSEAILKLAHEQANESNLDTAVDLAQRIPRSSALYTQAQEKIRAWRTEWQRGEAIYAEVQTALQDQDWDVASAKVKSLREFSHPYWRSRQVHELFQQISAEKQAHYIATQAQRLAMKGSTQDLKQAIATARTVDPSTYSWVRIQPNITDWNQALLDEGLALWHDGQLRQAITLGDVVATHSPLRSAAYDLILLSKARQREIASESMWEPTVAHLWHLNQAIAIASNINPDSQFYPQATASIDHWNQHLVDLKQLHHAQLAANFATKDGYHYAIQQASQIDAERPRRLQAQTLISHWQKEIERIEDRPHLTRARQLAASGTTEDIRGAIERAQQIAPGRALYGEAQSLISGWQSELQARVDRPILNQAIHLANQGRLQEAINTAAQIQPGRSLHHQAQQLIARWRNELNKQTLEQDAPSAQEEEPDTPLTDSSEEVPLDLLPPVRSPIPTRENQRRQNVERNDTNESDLPWPNSPDQSPPTRQEDSDPSNEEPTESRELPTPRLPMPMLERSPELAPLERRENEQYFEPTVPFPTPDIPEV